MKKHKFKQNKNITRRVVISPNPQDLTFYEYRCVNCGKVYFYTEDQVECLTASEAKCTSENSLKVRFGEFIKNSIDCN